MKFSEYCKQFLERNKLVLGVAFAVLVPLKLNFAYCILVPLILLWCISELPGYIKPTFEQKRISPLLKPLLVFVGASALSSLFGINPFHSIRPLTSLTFFLLTIPVLADIIKLPKGYSVIVALLTSQALVGMYTGLSAGFPLTLPRVFLGRVTESGQIGLSLILACGFLVSLLIAREGLPWSDLKGEKKDYQKALPLGAINLLLLSLIGFSHYFQLNNSILLLVVGAWILSMALSLRWILKLRAAGSISSALRALLCSVIIPGIIIASLVNLKRGPWSGIIIGGSIFLFIYGRRFILPALVAAAIVFTTVSPIRTRIAQSSRDFFIQGGRNVIWEVGIELAPRYPLGIGYGNSEFLQKFSAQIPRELRHFHNNFLNLLIENGWIAFTSFLWWIGLVVYTGFSKRPDGTRYVLGPTVACAIISWQIAGIVEYNAGDSEVMLVVYTLVALLVAIKGRDLVEVAVPAAQDKISEKLGASLSPFQERLPRRARGL